MVMMKVNFSTPLRLNFGWIKESRLLLSDEGCSKIIRTNTMEVII